MSKRHRNRLPEDFASTLRSWIDTTDWSTLFQDEEGTIPVTEAGQPVRCIRNKGNGEDWIWEPTDPPWTSAIDRGGLRYVEGLLISDRRLYGQT